MKEIDMSGKYEPIDVKTATTAQLVEWYNKNSGGINQIKKFSTREVAERRCSDLMKAMDEMATRGKPQPKKEPKMAAKKAKGKKAGKGAKKATKAAGGSKRKFAVADKKIYKLVDKNPRREGTEGYKSWEKIKNGMTYDAYLDAGGRNRDLRHEVLAKRVELRD